MAMEKIAQNNEDYIERFIFNWHSFTIDYWWRKKYHIAFGCREHREMNFIDMLIEYNEEKLLYEAFELSKKEKEDEEDEKLGLRNPDEVELTKEAIDEDYNNLDLSQFNE